MPKHDAEKSDIGGQSAHYFITSRHYFELNLQGKGAQP